MTSVMFEDDAEGEAVGFDPNSNAAVEFLDKPFYGSSDSARVPGIPIVAVMTSIPTAQVRTLQRCLIRIPV